MEFMDEKASNITLHQPYNLPRQNRRNLSF